MDDSQTVGWSARSANASGQFWIQSTKEAVIGKNQNTFAKMQREKEKKRKADDKRQRRLDRKYEQSNPAAKSDHDSPDDSEIDPAEDEATTIENESA